MMQIKYTPGPWTQGWSKNGIDCVWLDGKTEPVSGMGDDNDWIDCVTEANARLIAAAPQLLEASMRVLEWFEAEDDHSKADFYQRMQMCRDAEEMIRSAIAKALGE